MQRLSKRLAGARIWSRRQAERMIRDGWVLVNDKQVSGDEIVFVKPTDKVYVREHGLVGAKKPNPKLYLCHKLPGEIVTYDDPLQRSTLFGRLQQMGLPSNLISVGRLDLQSQGLIVLTNNGHLSRLMELPATGMVRKYRVRVWSRGGHVSEDSLRRLEKGLQVEGVNYGPMYSRLLEKSNKQANERWLEISVQEGKNREVRKVLAALGLQVTRLIRTQYGPFLLGNLAKGDVVKVAKIPPPLRKLLNQSIDENQYE